MTRKEKLFQFIINESFNETEMPILVNKLKTFINDIAEDFFVGRVNVCFKNNSVITNSDALFFNEVLYDCGRINEACHTEFKHSDGLEGELFVSVDGRDGYEWSHEDRMIIDALINYLSLVFARCQIALLKERESFFDPETCIHNMAFMKRFAYSLEKNDEFSDYALLFINIRGYRIFTRREGVRAAEKMVWNLCHALDDFVAPNEVVSHSGADNVVLLVKKERVVNALKCIDSVHVPIFKNGRDINIHVDSWVGVYFIQPDVTFIDALNYSSIAMSHSKTNKNNQKVFVFDDALLNDFDKRHSILAMFPIGLRDKEFEVYYQPKANVGNQIIGAEGLVRWNRHGKILSPSEFIPALEEEGSIIDLDFYVLENICCDLREWIDKGIEPVRISTNFSKDHFRNDGTADRIFRIMKKYDIPGRYLQIEITEMSRFDDWQKVIDFIKDLHKYDITVAIDDFGMGYSSLNLLKDYEADIVKIDKSLLHDIEHNPKAKTLLEYTIKLSKDIGMDVVVEGVETRKQLGYVANTGCEIVQGFYFDKPLQKDVFESRLNNKSYKKG